MFLQKEVASPLFDNPPLLLGSGLRLHDGSSALRLAPIWNLLAWSSVKCQSVNQLLCSLIELS